MYYIPARLFALNVPEYVELAANAGVDASALTWGNFFLKNLLPVTIGNILGGTLLALCLWATHLHSNEKPFAPPAKETEENVEKMYVR